MKIGLSTYSLSRAIRAGELTVVGAIRWIAENGGEHVEVSLSGFSLEENDTLVAEMVRAARESGIDIASYTIGADLKPRADKELRAEVERLKRNVDIGAALGVKRMRHDVISRPIPETTLEQFERDLPTAVAADEMYRQLNYKGEPTFEATAPTGVGVFDTLKAVAKQVLMELRKK